MSDDLAKKGMAAFFAPRRPPSQTITNQTRMTQTRVGQQDAVGLLILTPDAVRTRLAEVDARFNTMNIDVESNLRPLGTQRSRDLISSWLKFQASWREFFEKYQSTLNLLTTGTGTVNRQITKFEEDLAAWQTAVRAENPSGRLVTAPITSTDPSKNEPAKGESIQGMPWYAVSALTVLAAGALGYVGYSGYQAVEEAKRKKKYLEEEVVPSLIGTRRARRSTLKGTLISASDPASDGTSQDSPTEGGRRQAEDGFGTVSDVRRRFRRSRYVRDGSHLDVETEAERDATADPGFEDPAYGGTSQDEDQDFEPALRDLEEQDE